MTRHLDSLRIRLKNLRKSPAQAVHGSRVLAKVVRAGLRFYDPELTRFEKIDQEIRKRARRLAQYRSREAMAEIRDWLQKRGVQLARESGPGRKLSVEKSRRVLELLASIECALDLLEQEGGQGHMKWKPLRRTLSRYQKKPKGNILHKVRKLSKRIEYQSRFFLSDLTSQQRKKIKRIHKGNEEIGRALDLDSLSIRFANSEVQKLAKAQREKGLKRISDCVRQ
ncbi:MAG: CHAD domain-containing protein [Bdellovibrionales bacterium]